MDSTLAAIAGQETWRTPWIASTLQTWSSLFRLNMDGLGDENSEMIATIKIQ